MPAERLPFSITSCVGRAKSVPSPTFPSCSSPPLPSPHLSFMLFSATPLSPPFLHALLRHSPPPTFPSCSSPPVPFPHLSSMLFSATPLPPPSLRPLLRQPLLFLSNTFTQALSTHEEQQQQTPTYPPPPSPFYAFIVAWCRIACEETVFSEPTIPCKTKSSLTIIRRTFWATWILKKLRYFLFKSYCFSFCLVS